MGLDHDIQTLLRSEFVQQINFSMAGIVVSGTGFLELSTHLSDNYIRRKLWVRVNPGVIGPGSEALYNSGQDTIYVRTRNVLDTPFGRGVVVHECTHAQIDLRGTVTPQRSNEGAAYIAEAWYHLACDADVALVAPSISPVIVAIATDLRRQSIRGGGAIVALSPQQINEAREAMSRYGNDPYLGNGIRGRVYREQ